MRHSRNRLIRHLTHCAAVYCCPNAINFFLGRYECPLPVSPHCNARCQGCISRQPSGGPPASQARLTFVPTPEEIAEVALIHASRARNPIVSFGQGCEGEPLLQTGRIAAAIARIRRQSRRVTIHMNTNAGMPEAIAGLAQAGLDSIRVSVNSCRPVFYRRYVSPRGFGFQDVLRTIRLAKRAGLFVAINYLVMPGFTDQEPECKALLGFIETTRIDMVQWRNLNIDPRWFFRSLRVPEKERCIGIAGVMRRVAEAFPQVRQGYFNVFRVPAQERNGETGWQSIS